jgi:transposase
LNILDRFHIVAKMNDALDDVRAAEARRLAQDGYEPVLHKSRWCVLKRKANLSRTQRFRLRDLLRYNLQTAWAYLLKESLWKERWAAAGPFGRTVLSIDDALRFIAREDIFRVMT